MRARVAAAFKACGRPFRGDTYEGMLFSEAYRDQDKHFWIRTKKGRLPSCPNIARTRCDLLRPLVSLTWTSSKQVFLAFVKDKALVVAERLGRESRNTCDGVRNEIASFFVP